MIYNNPMTYAKKKKVTITLTGSGYDGSCYVKVRDSKGSVYYDATTLELEVGTVIDCYSSTLFTGSSPITLNGNSVGSASTNGLYRYAYTVSKNATIALTYKALLWSIAITDEQL